MNNGIIGTDRLIYFKWDGEFLPVGCLISDNFDESSEMIDTTTVDNEGWTTSVPTNQSYNFSFDGLLINTKFNGGDFSKISYDRLRDLKRDRILTEWKIQDINKTFVDTGFGHITSLSDSSSIDEFITFSATVTGFGKPTSKSEQALLIQDGNDNVIQDGNDNIITT